MEYRRFVLVVDDERMIADTLTIILQRSGFIAAACYSADDAVSILSTVAPDILISDVIMGDRSGVEVAIVARELFPECRVILISGNAATADEQISMLLGSQELHARSRPHALAAPTDVAGVEADGDRH